MGKVPAQKFTPNEVIKKAIMSKNPEAINNADAELKEELAKTKQDLKRIGQAPYLLGRMSEIYKLMEEIAIARQIGTEGSKPKRFIINEKDIPTEEEKERILREDEGPEV